MGSEWEGWELSSVVVGKGVRFENIDEFEVENGEEGNFGRCGVKVLVNECEFMVGIGLEVE